MSLLDNTLEVRINKGKVKFVYVDKGEENYYSQFGYLKGISKWAKIIKPDDYGNYAVDVYPTAEDFSHIKDVATELLNAAKEALTDAGKKINNIANIGKVSDDGENYIQFKRKAMKPDGTEVSAPKVYDASGTHIDGWDKLVGNGSVVKVGYTLTPYYVNGNLGISFKFYAIQIIKLSEYSGGSNTNSGFGDETDGSAPFDTNEDF